MGSTTDLGLRLAHEPPPPPSFPSLLPLLPLVDLNQAVMGRIKHHARHPARALHRQPCRAAARELRRRRRACRVDMPVIAG
ncbi:hypothetical protein PsYK624_101360 [Phanerochaete sordida]|uniref:Uncharacterized protein n=1 Tax=Phanerochaete sordida TaxID=48140 RepID=A0A9P3LGT5_9APHY|nr:hypothetical protein PsYK624_101360 [Phanerochaete sordida]